MEGPSSGKKKKGKQPPVCSLCCSECWRVYKIGGNKWNKSQIENKLKRLGIIQEGSKIIGDIGVCDKCLTKMDNALSFINESMSNITKSSHLKRGAHSPVDTERGQPPASKKVKLQNRQVPKKSAVTENEQKSNSKHGAIDHSYADKQSSEESTNTPSLLFAHTYAAKAIEKEDDQDGDQMDVDVSILSDIERKSLAASVKGESLDDFVAILMKTKHVWAAIKQRILGEINKQAVSLCSRSNKSVLRSMSSVDELQDTEIIPAIIKEMKERIPFLFEVFSTMAQGSVDKKIDTDGPFAAIYSMLMVMRNKHLSAFSRSMTLILTKFSLNDEGLEYCHKMYLCQSDCAKVNLLDDCAKNLKKRTVEMMKKCFLCHFIGDNCDFKIRPNNLIGDHAVKDCHYFATLIVFSRMAEQMLTLDDTPPNPEPKDIPLDQFFLTQREREQYFKAIKVILARLMLLNLPCFGWVKEILPEHIYHLYQELSGVKTVFLPQDMQFLDEKKYEDTCRILINSATSAREMADQVPGGRQLLFKRRMPFLGDQLTRMRMEYSKILFLMAPTAEGRLDDIGPFLCTLWHMKQDLVEKAYKQLWNPKCLTDKCTLFFIKTLTNMTNANGTVKGNFKAHEQLLLLAGEFCIIEQVMGYLEMDGYDDWPRMIPRNVGDLEDHQKRQILNKCLDGFLAANKYYNFSLQPDDAVEEANGLHLFQTEDGEFFILDNVDDEVMNYQSCLAVWALQLMQMNDLAKEGDLERSILSAKANIPLFYSHSKMSKYYVESMDYVLKTDILASPQMRLRLLDASFINKEGGVGNNMEADLAMEHNIRERKELIGHLGSNKTEKAILRATSAASCVTKIADQFAKSLHIKKKSGRHTHYVSEEDRNKVKEAYRELQPFNKTLGRKYRNISIKHDTPFKKIDKQEMRRLMSGAKVRLCRGQMVRTDDD